MANKYNNIQQLIDLWDAFERANSTHSFADFGRWLMDDPTMKNTKRASLLNSQDTTDRVKSGPEHEADAKQLFFSLISRLSRLQDFYTKKFFEGLPLNNLLEFNFLFYINKNASIRKKEIIDYHHVEYTTGIDIIKRLIKLLLVSESKDQLDRRSKRLKITSEGKRVLMEALIRINKITHVFFDTLENENWMGCLKVLSALEDYHKKIFAKSNTNTSYELLNSINSTHIGA